MRVRARQHAAVQALPNSYISSNDIVFAIAWLLGCEMKQRPWPGQAPAGSTSVGLIVADLVMNDLQGRLSRALVPAGLPFCQWHMAVVLHGDRAACTKLGALWASVIACVKWCMHWLHMVACQHDAHANIGSVCRYSIPTPEYRWITIQMRR